MAMKAVTVTARRRTEIEPCQTHERARRPGTKQQVYAATGAQRQHVAYMHTRQSSVSIRGLGNNPAAMAWKAAWGATHIDNVYLRRGHGGVRPDGH